MRKVFGFRFLKDAAPTELKEFWVRTSSLNDMKDETNSAVLNV